LREWKEEGALGYWLKLCRRYGCQEVLTVTEAAQLNISASHPLVFLLTKTYPEFAVPSQIPPSHPILSLDVELFERDYKSLLHTARLGSLSSALEVRACKLLKRRSPEATLCLRLIAKSQGRMYSPELVQSVMQYCVRGQLAEIAHIVMASIGYDEFDYILKALNPWETYQTAVKLLRRGEYRTSQTLLNRVISSYSSDNIGCYQWLQALLEVVMLEQNLVLPEQLEVLSRLACTGLGDKVAFQSGFMVLRLGLLQMPQLLSRDPVSARRSANMLRRICEELRNYYPSGPQDHVGVLREWSEWMSLITLSCDLKAEGVQAVKEGIAAFLPTKANIVLTEIEQSSSESLLGDLGKLLASQKFRYPRRFFLPAKPLSVRLQLPYDDSLKVHSQDEISIEFSCIQSCTSFPTVLITVVLIDTDVGEKLAETVQRRRCSSAGVVSSSVLVRTPGVGNFLLRLEAAIITGAGRKVGKREFATLRLVAIQ